MGHAESFQCAYHFFEFNLDGSKKFVPDEDTFTQGVPQETALVEVPCDTWGGFVWFNMNPDAESLDEFLGVVAEHLAPYHFEDYAIGQDMTIEWDANWKASVDAFNEVYHVQGMHIPSCWSRSTTSTCRSICTSATTATSFPSGW